MCRRPNDESHVGALQIKKKKQVWPSVNTGNGKRATRVRQASPCASPAVDGASRPPCAARTCAILLCRSMSSSTRSTTASIIISSVAAENLYSARVGVNVGGNACGVPREGGRWRACPVLRWWAAMRGSSGKLLGWPPTPCVKAGRMASLARAQQRLSIQRRRACVQLPCPGACRHAPVCFARRLASFPKSCNSNAPSCTPSYRSEDAP